MIIYTIGHSSHSSERFRELLTDNAITAVADVRSRPSSRYCPQFDREILSRTLTAHGIAYVFVGAELGARSTDPDCLVDGSVSYARLARTEAFRSGLERVIRGAARYTVALMCAEKDPLDCHRTLLVARALEYRNAQIRHILDDGRVESHADAMTRLLKETGLPQADMISCREELVELACRRRESRIAWSMDDVREERVAG